jgi:broad specificity phosphatase PhoE
MPPTGRPPFRLPPRLTATLVLVRHGESTWIAEGRFQGRLDPPLSALGERQAKLVAERLARPDAGVALPLPVGSPIGVWHSPLARASHTAQLIAEACTPRLALRAAAGLTEIAQGEWEGLPADEVRSRWPDELAAWRRSPVTDHAPGGESLAAAGARVAGAVAEIVAQLAVRAGVGGEPDPDQAAAAASVRFDPVPGYPVTEVAGDPPPEPWAVLVAHDGIFRLALMTLLRLPFERFWSFPFNLCAISVIGLHGGVPVLRAHNLTEHLEPLADEERAAAEARGERRGAL